METTDVVVIGAGVVGAAVAHALSRKNKSVLVLETGPSVGEGITSRNSGVVHAGIYYKPGSLKARSCIEGNRLLYEWCLKHHVPCRKTGKLVLAKSKEEEEELTFLLENARASGAEKVRLIGSKEIEELEPSLKGPAALYCDDSGIVDPVELTRSLIVNAEELGATLVTHATVQGIVCRQGGFDLKTTRGPIQADQIINCAGLMADQIAKLVGVSKYKIHFCRGDYFHFKTKVAYRHLVYPVKRKSHASLGVHLKIDLAGNYGLGPDAEYISDLDTKAEAHHKLDLFLESARRLLDPNMEKEQLSYDTFGIRPKLRGPDDKGDRDFVISEDVPGFINLIGIDSPGLTAALSLAHRVAEMA